MKKALLLALLMFTSVLSGCLNQGGDEEDSEEEEQREELGDWDVYLVSETADLPTCDQQTLGRLYYVEMISEFRVCKSTGWTAIEIGSSNNLTNLILTELEPAPEHCEAGGFIENFGKDDGARQGIPNNGILEDGEIEQSVLYCSNYVEEVLYQTGSLSGLSYEFSTETHMFYSQYRPSNNTNQLFSLNLDTQAIEFLMNHSGIYYGTDTDNGSVFSARTSDGGDNLVISDGSQNGTTILTPIPGVLYYAEELNGDILYVLTNDKEKLYVYYQDTGEVETLYDSQGSANIRVEKFSDTIYLLQNGGIRATTDIMSDIESWESVGIYDNENENIKIFSYREGIVFECEHGGPTICYNQQSLTGLNGSSVILGAEIITTAGDYVLYRTINGELMLANFTYTGFINLGHTSTNVNAVVLNDKLIINNYKQIWEFDLMNLTYEKIVDSPNEWAEGFVAHDSEIFSFDASSYNHHLLEFDINSHSFTSYYNSSNIYYPQPYEPSLTVCESGVFWIDYAGSMDRIRWNRGVQTTIHIL